MQLIQNDILKPDSVKVDGHMQTRSALPILQNRWCPLQ